MILYETFREFFSDERQEVPDVFLTIDFYGHVTTILIYIMFSYKYLTIVKADW